LGIIRKLRGLFRIIADDIFVCHLSALKAVTIRYWGQTRLQAVINGLWRRPARNLSGQCGGEITPSFQQFAALDVTRKADAAFVGVLEGKNPNAVSPEPKPKRRTQLE
jgi:hypothetical protein